MIAFDDFKPEGNAPIYIEIVQFIKKQIIAEEIQNEDALPSRREVSARLGINPNTVQKAYKLLEEEGLIESRLGAKSCVSVNEEILGRIKKELMEAEVKRMVVTMQEIGMSKEDTMSLVEELWELSKEEKSKC